MKGVGKQAAGGLTGKRACRKVRPALVVAAGLSLALLIATAALGSGVTMRASTDSAGNQANGFSIDAAVSADARYVAFSSGATNLVGGDTNGLADVFIKDNQTGTTTRVSTDAGGGQVNGNSQEPSLSADGRYVAFYSGASNLVMFDTNGVDDVFLKDTQTGAVTRVSTSTGGSEGDAASFAPAVSANGRFVAFTSDATTLVPGDLNWSRDIFVKDTLTDFTTLVSTDSSGNQGSSYSEAPAISGDGRYVAFSSFSTNLVAGDTNGMLDVFVKDRQTGATTRLSTDSAGVQGNGYSYEPSISADGRYVAYHSEAGNLVAGDTNGMRDVFVKDRITGTTTRASIGPLGPEGYTSSHFASISADGRYVAFHSMSDNLVPGDTNGYTDVYVKDLQTGALTLVSTDGAGNEGNFFSLSPAIAADGRSVAFYSWASDLIVSDTNSERDVFVADTSIACSAGQPSLTLQINNIYWASMFEYTSAMLSVDFGVQNNGAGGAYAAQITSVTATSGVTCFTCSPSVGNIAPGAANALTVKYLVPGGVLNFGTTLTASAQDGCGTGYAYP